MKTLLLCKKVRSLQSPEYYTTVYGSNDLETRAKSSNFSKLPFSPSLSSYSFSKSFHKLYIASVCLENIFITGLIQEIEI